MPLNLKFNPAKHFFFIGEPPGNAFLASFGLVLGSNWSGFVVKTWQPWSERMCWKYILITGMLLMRWAWKSHSTQPYWNFIHPWQAKKTSQPIRMSLDFSEFKHILEIWPWVIPVGNLGIIAGSKSCTMTYFSGHLPPRTNCYMSVCWQKLAKSRITFFKRKPKF